MADDIYSNIRVPSYQVGKFQFKSGLLILTNEDDKAIFKRILAQIPAPERLNITQILDGVDYPFPADWILRKDLRFAEIAADGIGAQQAARDNLGIGDSGLNDGDYGGIIVTGNGSNVALVLPNVIPSRFNVTTPNATWIINHGLGRVPIAQIFLDDGEQVFADYAGGTSLATFTFSQPHTGFAVLY